MHKTHCILAALALVAMASCTPLSAADGPTADEVKAACLYYFTTFTEWPDEAFPGPLSPIRIGIVESDSMAEEVAAAVSGKTVKGRPVVVEQWTGADHDEPFHLVYIGSAGQRRSREVVDQQENLWVLTVGESKNFTRDGGIIQFYMEESTVRFEINLEAAESAGLSISSQLLKLARITPAEEARR